MYVHLQPLPVRNIEEQEQPLQITGVLQNILEECAVMDYRCGRFSSVLQQDDWFGLLNENLDTNLVLFGSSERFDCHSIETRLELGVVRIDHDFISADPVGLPMVHIRVDFLLIHGHVEVRL